MKNKNKQNKLNPHLIIPEYILTFLIIIFGIFLVFTFHKYFVVYAPVFYQCFNFSKFQAFDPSIFLKYFINFLYAFLLLVSSKGFGNFIVKRLDFIEEDYFDFKEIFAFGFGFSFIILFLFFLGILGFLFKPVVLVFLCFGIFLFFYSREFSGKNKSKIDLTSKISFFEIIFVFLIIVSILYLIPCILVPETFYDSLLSNLGVPYKWLQNNRIYSIPYNIYSDIPYNIGLLYLIGLMFSDTSLPKIINFIFFLLSSRMIFVFVKRFTNRKLAVFCSGFFILTPLTLLLSTRTGFEMGLIFFELLSVLSIFVFLKNNQFGWLVVSGFMNGMALGGKYTSVMSTVSIITAMFFIGILVEKKSYKQVLREIFIFGLTATITVSPWLIRNFINWGNPFVPMLEFLGRSETARVIDVVDPGYVNWNIQKILFAPWYIVTGKLQQESFIGFVYILIFPFLFLLRNVSKELKFLNIYVFVYLVFGLISSNAYIRYFLPVFPVIGILYGFYIFYFDSKHVKNLILFFSTILFILNIAFAINIIYSSMSPISNFLGFMSDHQYLSTMRSFYPAAYYDASDWINKNTPKNAKILLVGDARSLYFERQIINSNTRNKTALVEYVKKVKDEDELFNILKSEKIGYIVLSPQEFIRLTSWNILYWNKRDLEVYNKFFDKHLKQVYRTLPDLEIKPNVFLQNDENLFKQYVQDAFCYIYIYQIVDFVDDQDKINDYNLLNLKKMYRLDKQKELFEN